MRRILSDLQHTFQSARILRPGQACPCAGGVATPAGTHSDTLPANQVALFKRGHVPYRALDQLDHLAGHNSAAHASTLSPTGAPHRYPWPRPRAPARGRTSGTDYCADLETALYIRQVVIGWL